MRSPLEPSAPLPGGEDERSRRKEAARRRRILTGLWRQDLTSEVAAFFPPETAGQLASTVDMSKNLMGRAASDLAALYHEPPVISHDVLDDLEPFTDALDASGLWQLSQDNQRSMWAVRESLLRVDWVEATGKLQFRNVDADLVWAVADPNDPDLPVALIEARPRTFALDGEKPQSRWTWDYIETRTDEGGPFYRVLLPAENTNDLKEAKDITSAILGVDAVEGESFPWRVGDKPVVPYVLFHAMRTGRLWDGWRLKELVCSTLRVGALWSHWGFCVRDASHPQRWMAGGKVVGGKVVSGGSTAARHEVPLNPASILVIEAEGAGVVQAGQWQAGCDPERLQLAIQSYERAALLDVGLETDDTQRTGAAMSGWAIAIKRSSVREKQQIMEPGRRRGDLLVLAMAASLLSRFGSMALPEDGWGITYKGLPLSPVEVETRTKQAKEDIDLGLASLVDVLIARNPGWSREQAIAHLEQVRQERAMFAVAQAPRGGFGQ